MTNLFRGTTHTGKSSIQTNEIDHKKAVALAREFRKCLKQLNIKNVKVDVIKTYG